MPPLDSGFGMWLDTYAMISTRNKITKEARFFLAPEKPLHRQYEALRAYFVEKQPPKKTGFADRRISVPWLGDGISCCAFPDHVVHCTGISSRC